jgi:hypothetical protein
VFVSFIEGTERGQINLLPACVDDYVASEALVRVIDAFVDNLDLSKPGLSPGGLTPAASCLGGTNPSEPSTAASFITA